MQDEEHEALGMLLEDPHMAAMTMHHMQQQQARPPLPPHRPPLMLNMMTPPLLPPHPYHRCLPPLLPHHHPLGVDPHQHPALAASRHFLETFTRSVADTEQARGGGGGGSSRHHRRMPRVSVSWGEGGGGEAGLTDGRPHVGWVGM